MRIVIHIGFHKTGTSSIQKCCDDLRGRLGESNIFFYSGALDAANHIELHASTMREGRQSPFRMSQRNFVHAATRPQWIRERLSSFIVHEGTYVFSAEGLSYLRHEDEMERLRWLFAGRTVEIIAYLRNRDDWLASYAAEMTKHPTPDSPLDDSYANTRPDSWLLDFERRLEPFRGAFGPANVTVVDYDEARSRERSVIPSFLRMIGADHIVPELSQADGYWLNGRNPAPKRTTA